MPILDIRGYTDGICTVAPCPPRLATDVDVHDGYHTLVTRARLQQANGHANNHVRMVITEVGNRGPESPLSIVSIRAVAQLDKWMTDIVNDKSNRPMAEKVAANRPKGFVDACYTSEDAQITNMEKCAQLFPIGSDARMVAGAPRTNDIMKCQLKPLAAADYKVSVSGPHMQKLQQAFAGGVCDYSKPGVGQGSLMGTWLSYGADGQVRSLGAAQ